MEVLALEFAVPPGVDAVTDRTADTPARRIAHAARHHRVFALLGRSWSGISIVDHDKAILDEYLCGVCSYLGMLLAGGCPVRRLFLNTSAGTLLIGSSYWAAEVASIFFNAIRASGNA